MILGILIFLSSITMFEDINMKDYNLDFELQWSYFLRDCLNEEISFVLEDRPSGVDVPPTYEQVMIYKKSNNGISEEISLDELIFYIHTEVADELDKINPYVGREITEADGINPKYRFYNNFNSIDSIKKAVNNMKIILKYDKNINKNEESKEEDVKETDEGKPFQVLCPLSGC